MDLLQKLQDGEKIEDASFQGSTVVLNQPEEGGQGFIVYAKNSKGDVVKVRFNKPEQDDSEFYAAHRCELQLDRSTPMYWACKMHPATVAVTDHAFETMAVYDSLAKTLTSVRDGVQEYLGIELGIEPASKVFTVYRSPETISAIAGQLEELAIIEDHIDVDKTPTSEQTIGLVGSTEVIEAMDSTTDSTLMLKHKANFSDKVLKIIDAGKKFFSLGYRAKMSKHDRYDFEQTDIMPVHLAIVDAARGGMGLKFQDRGKIMFKEFLDADGKITMQGLADLLKALMENLQNIDMGEAKKIGQLLQKATSIAEGGGGEESGAEEGAEGAAEGAAEEMKDADNPEKKEEEKTKVTDSKTEGKVYTDAAFADAVDKLAEEKAKERVEVLEKAKTVLPETYDFKDKSPKELMIDCLELDRPGEVFADADISMAFKFIRPAADQYKNFGDSVDDSIYHKEM